MSPETVEALKSLGEWVNARPRHEIRILGRDFSDVYESAAQTGRQSAFIEVVEEIIARINAAA